MQDSQFVVNRIREATSLRGVTPNKAFLKSGAGKDFIANLLKGHQLPTASKFYLLADYLDCSVDYLLGRTDVPDVNRGGGDLRGKEALSSEPDETM
jgi:transcriptional regulator with XRE-family HTH domain